MKSHFNQKVKGVNDTLHRKLWPIFSMSHVWCIVYYIYNIIIILSLTLNFPTATRVKDEFGYPKPPLTLNPNTRPPTTTAR